MASSELLQIVITALYIITIAGIIFVIISENRNPIRALAWTLVLIFVPAIGVLFFYFFGQSNRKIKHITSSYKEAGRSDENLSVIRKNSDNITRNTTRLISLLEKNNGALLLHGSEVEVITNGSRKLKLLLDDITNARHHIHLQYFLFANDETGRKIKKLLMRKASEGVAVRFLYDNVANIGVPAKFYSEMKQAGVHVRHFINPFLPWFKSRMNYRNHRKVVVIDGTTGYVGGMNIGNNYSNNPNWRDTHLRISGKGAYGLQQSFIVDWETSNNEKLSDKNFYFPPCKEKTDNRLQIATCGPNTTWPNLLQATIHITVSAWNYLYIQTPYFIPTESLLEALQTAALSGVDIRLMVSRKSDSSYIDPASKSYYTELLHAGIRIYEHPVKFIHAKTMVSDDFISVIGSANMDFRSFETNFEINCYLYDEILAKRNKQIFLEDMGECDEVLPDVWAQRSWWCRIKESFMRLFAPLL